MTRTLDIHCIAIGGTGMAPTACLLKALGHRVRGSDGPLYPPMSELLAAEGIEPMVGFEARHLDPEPDLVVVGNAVPRDNPEARETDRRGLRRVSMPEALYRFCLADRRRWVIAGTHGKTTTTSMAAWALTAAGREPGFLVGGIPENLGQSFRLGDGKEFVIEGDEYNAAYFDRGPKFLHYRPQVLILTSVEYDHADLYPSPDALVGAYETLVNGMGEEGMILACGDSSAVREVVSGAACRVVLYGLDEGLDIAPVGPVDLGEEATRCRVRGPSGAETDLALPMPGRHNLTNALAVWGAAVLEGVDPSAAAAALESFRGVRRRLSEVGRSGDVVVIDDFAHHPTAVAATVEAIRQRYPRRRVVTVFEPRSLTAGRALFHGEYRRAFSTADVVLFAPVYHNDRLAPEERLNLIRLCRELAVDGTVARAAPSLDDLLDFVGEEVMTGDVVVCMSSGSFEGIPSRILARLAAGRGA